MDVHERFVIDVAGKSGHVVPDPLNDTLPVIGVSRCETCFPYHGYSH